MRIIGTAEGIITPTIITVHMANTNANSAGGHGLWAGTMSPLPDRIIRKPLMSMPPVPVSTDSHTK